MGNAFQKAMNYLALSAPDERDERDADNFETEALQVETDTAQHNPLDAVVTPLQRSTPTHAAQQLPVTEILTVHPRSYSEAPHIAENFREGVPMIMNLSQMPDADARRLIDFAGGLVLGLNGHMERVTGKVFLLTPEHVAVSDLAEAPAAAPEPADTFFVAPRQ